MVSLTEGQEALLKQLQHVALSSASYLPNTLIYGPPGTGKRTIVRNLSDSLGLEFIEVNVSDSAQFVRERLFGTWAHVAAGEPYELVPGELSRSDEMVLFLSGFQGLSDELFQIVQRLLTRKAYLDSTGSECRIGAGVWIIAGMQESSDLTERISIDLSHWLCSHFEHQFRLAPPQEPQDLQTIAESMLGEYGCSLEEPPDLELVETVQNASDCLRGLRRWLASASSQRSEKGLISRQSIDQAVVNDLQTIFSQLEYRGVPLDTARFESWAVQFGDFRPTAIHILRWIARAYFISDREYYRGIEHLVQRSGIPKRSQVIFCKWQTEGKSGPRVQNQMKEQAHWRVVSGEEIDLTKNEADWHELDTEINHQIVLVDDFVGSGKTIAKLFVGKDAPIRRLLSRLPKARVWIGIIVGYDSALQRALSAIGEYASRVTLTPYRLLTEDDKCFSESSRILTNPKTRKQFREFCLDVAERCCHLPRGLRLGFKETGALVVFSNTVPNNSLPLIWHDEGTWVPLFPASGLPISDDVMPGEH